MLGSAKLEDPGTQSEEQEAAGTAPDVERWLSCYACRMVPRPPAGPTEECARCGGRFCPRCLIGQLCFMCHSSENENGAHSAACRTEHPGGGHAACREPCWGTERSSIRPGDVSSERKPGRASLSAGARCEAETKRG